MARMGEHRGVHRVLVGKPEGKRPLGRPRCRWEDNIKMDLQEGGRGRGEWLGLAQDRDRWWRALVGTVRERGHWGDEDIDGRIILRWIFRKLEGVVGTGWSWLRIGTGGGRHLWVQ